MTQKNYVFDTSTLICNPYAWKDFENSKVIIPIAVLSELDDLKKHSGDVGKHARVCIKALDAISDMGDISTGVLLDNDILLKVDTHYNDFKNDNLTGFGNPNYGDNQILACAHLYNLEFPNEEIILVSQDINLRVKAKSRGIAAINYEEKGLIINELYAGYKVIKDENLGMSLQASGTIDASSCSTELNLNECVLFESENGDGIARGRKISNNQIKLIKKIYPWSISARNKEQEFAIDLIMDTNIDLVTLIGKAGTGKTLVILASALELVMSKKEYKKLVIYRPIQPVGNDIGFLPGTMEEKLAPWFQAIMDNFEILLSKNPDWKKDLELWQRKGRIEMNAITYIRGRSIPNSIILVDEAQNLTKEEIKTILTRAGEGSKIILNGDIEQIDNMSLDATNNGLTYIIDKFKNSEIAGHITFTQGERSRLASTAAQIL